MDSRMTRVETVLFGPFRNTGLVRDIDHLRKDVKELKIAVSAFHVIIRTIKWVVLALGVLTATFTPDSVVKMIKVLADVSKLSP